MGRTLNIRQREVAENLSENILLYASAGTGKTTTVAHRIANILQSGRAEPSQILCLTFTIKAAKELLDDVQSIAGERANGVCVQTIHGFCYRLIREEERIRNAHYSEPQVIDEVDSETILESVYLANAPVWRLSEALKRAGIKDSVEMLMGRDMLMLENKLGWKIGNLFITREGSVHSVPAYAKLQNPMGNCPRCGKEYALNESVCDECGTCLPPLLGLPEEAPPTLFARKKNPMQGVVTLIKHARAEQGFYSDDSAADYQSAWEWLTKHRTEEAERTLSYFDKKGRGAGGEMAVDKRVWEVLSRHAGELLSAYEGLLLASNQLDFDDLILRAARYLEDEETRQRHASRYAYITVDEMQDTSVTEYTLLKNLFAGNNVMMCGDFFQTIYGWRGSSPVEVLGDFEREFSPKIYAFEENYRATKTLACAGFGYLKNTYPQLLGRYGPEEITVNSTEDGEKVLCLGFDSLQEEAAQIYAYCAKQRPKSSSELCVMARSNSYIAMLSAAFERLNARRKEEDRIRFFTVEKDHGFFKRSCVKDVLAVMKLLINPADTVSMERIAGKYIRGVGVRSLEQLRTLSSIGVSSVSFLEKCAYTEKDAYHVLIEGVKTGNIVVYDTETTGLDLSMDEMVQISAVRLNEKGEVIDTLDIMVNPTVPIGQGAYETHGFDEKYILEHGGVSAKEALLRFSRFVDGAVLVGHNSLRFDRSLVRRQLKEQGLPPLNILGEYDTLCIAKQFLAGLPDYKLSTLCARYGVVNEAAHNAFGDICATAKVLIALVNECVLPTQKKRMEATGRFAAKFEKFFDFYRSLIPFVEDNRLGDLVRTIVSKMNMPRFYPSDADREALLDLVGSLECVESKDGESFLAAYLADAALSGSQMDVLLGKLQKIPIITVHQAKGCEFDTVILAGVSQRFFPTALSRGTPQEDEEKKVFYVALTRAKKKLIMTRVTKDYHSGEHIAVSPYFYAIPSDCVWTNEDWL